MRIFAATFSLLFTAICWAQTTAVGSPQQGTQPTPSTCVFTYKPDSVKVFWTGYKFTEKKGAKGEFKNIVINASQSAHSPEELILSTAVDIDTTKSDSGDPGRDSNLLNHFFKKMKGGLHIKGGVQSYQSGILKVKTQMNGVSKTLAFLVTNEGNKYKAATDFDMVDLFKMKKPYESISNVCRELHKGPDGKSKTWTQVSLSLEGEIINSCEVIKAGATSGN